MYEIFIVTLKVLNHRILNVIIKRTTKGMFNKPLVHYIIYTTPTYTPLKTFFFIVLNNNNSTGLTNSVNCAS